MEKVWKILWTIVFLYSVARLYIGEADITDYIVIFDVVIYVILVLISKVLFYLEKRKRAKEQRNNDDLEASASE